MADAPVPRIAIVGGGPAGRAAHALLPGAQLVAAPEARAWHAEPGLLWILRGGRVESLAFDLLLVAAPALQLLLALGCGTRGWAPVVDEAGRCTRPGIFAAGAILGAATAEEAAAQGRIAARALLGLPAEGAITPRPPAAEPLPPGLACACLGLEEAALSEEGVRSAAEAADLFGLHRGACRMARCGPRLGGGAVPIAPALPVPLAALAALAGEKPPPRPLQQDGALA